MFLKRVKSGRQKLVNGKSIRARRSPRFIHITGSSFPVGWLLGPGCAQSRDFPVPKHIRCPVVEPPVALFLPKLLEISDVQVCQPLPLLIALPILWLNHRRFPRMRIGRLEPEESVQQLLAQFSFLKGDAGLQLLTAQYFENVINLCGPQVFHRKRLQPDEVNEGIVNELHA